MSFVGLANTLNEFIEEGLHRFLSLRKSTMTVIEDSVTTYCLEQNPHLYFIFETKLQSQESLDWVNKLLSGLPEDRERPHCE